MSEIYRGSDHDPFDDDDFDFDVKEYRKMYNQSKRGANKSARDSGDHGSRGRTGNGGKGKKKEHKGRHIFGRVVLSMFLVVVITVCLVVGSVLVYAFNFVDSTMSENLDHLTMNFTTTVYVQNERTGEWEELQRLHGGENRIWISLEEMPQNLQNAFIAIEDKRFADHNGVDWKRTFSAFANLFLHFYSSNQGGSTITQQLVKNLTGDKKTDAMRKIREIMRARYLEIHYSKETILECYLNIVPLAHGISGVEVAANYYFGKSANELSLVECASLAGMARNPEGYRPDLNPEENKKRRNTVLYEMLDQGYISQKEYNGAIKEDLEIVAKDNEKEQQINSYFVDALIDEVISDLSKTYNYDETYAANNFYNGGYKIYCTMVPSIQEAIDKVYQNPSYFRETQQYKGETYNVQSSMTVMDYQGHVVGIVGGQGKKTVNRGLNRATDMPNQPGSTIKPVAAYAPAIESNTITYSTILKDQTTMTVNGKKWPANASGYYGGNTFAYKALERSINTIPVNLINQMGLEKSFKFLHDTLKYTYLDEDIDMNLASIGLGGNSRGVTTMQAAAAYAIFGNLGKYYEPTTYLTITDQFGKEVILSNEDYTPTIAISEDTACVMNHMLQNVIYGSQGTGAAVRGFSSKFKAYGKTGSTNDNLDCWFVGGTPYYVAACWYGYDYNNTIRNMGSANLLWRTVMSSVHANLDPRVFEESQYVQKRKYCTSTGLLATTSCPGTATGYFKSSYLPACTRHSGKLADPVK